MSSPEMPKPRIRPVSSAKRSIFTFGLPREAALHNHAGGISRRKHFHVNPIILQDGEKLLVEVCALKSIQSMPIGAPLRRRSQLYLSRRRSPFEGGHESSQDKDLS